MPGLPPGAATPLQSLRSPVLLSSAGAGNRRGTAPGAENQPSLRQAKGRRPMNHRCRLISVSVAPTSLGREPGQFCRLQFRGCPGWSGFRSLFLRDVCRPCSQGAHSTHTAPLSQVLRTGPGQAQKPQAVLHGVPLGTGLTLSPEMLVLGDSLPPWLLSERLQSGKRGSTAPRIRPSEHLGRSWMHSGLP